MNACQGTVEGCRARATNLLSLLHSLPPHRLSPSARSRVSKLITSELRFLHTHPDPPLNSTNLGYLEAVVQVLQHPRVGSVSAVLQTFKATSSVNNAPEAVKSNLRAKEAHVDVVCTFYSKPVWIIVSDKNPKYLYWSDECNDVKGWKHRVELLVGVAQSLCVLRPSAVVFCFARGVPGSVLAGFEGDFGASHVHWLEEQKLNHSDPLENSCLEFGSRLIEEDDGDWVCIYVSKEQADWDRLSQKGRISRCWDTFLVDIHTQLEGSQSLECGVLKSKLLEGRTPTKDLCIHVTRDLTQKVEGQDDTWPASKQQHEGIHSDDGACSDSFLSCLGMIRSHLILSDKKQTPHSISSFVATPNILNLDTTSLIALVSEVSNGAATTLVNMNNEDLVSKFKSTAQFMKDQAIEELKYPMMKEMTDIFEYRRPFMSETVCKEFESLVSLCGSFKEKIRAEELLQVILVVPDTPSTRVRNLAETGKIKEKNKVIFGTGDFWQAPTLTANLSFVRAVQQTGMALSTLEHNPRALVGEKCPL